MTEAPLPTLSVQTEASVQGVVRARNELEQWTKNLEQALADDVAAEPPRLTHDQAAQVAKTYGVHSPSAHPAKQPEETHQAPAAATATPEPEPQHSAAHEEKADTGHKVSDEKAKKPSGSR